MKTFVYQGVPLVINARIKSCLSPLYNAIRYLYDNHGAVNVYHVSAWQKVDEDSDELEPIDLDEKEVEYIIIS